MLEANFLQQLFNQMELETKTEISFQDRFRLAQYEKSDGLCYIVGDLVQTLDFFIDLGDNNMHFLQNGDFVKLNNLDIENTFWGIKKITTPNVLSGRCEHLIYCYVP